MIYVYLYKNILNIVINTEERNSFVVVEAFTITF
jgi:hypothetical protein